MKNDVSSMFINDISIFENIDVSFASLLLSRSKILLKIQNMKTTLKISRKTQTQLLLINIYLKLADFSRLDDIEFY